jgi:hypothetical protein
MLHSNGGTKINIWQSAIVFWLSGLFLVGIAVVNNLIVKHYNKKTL